MTIYFAGGEMGAFIPSDSSSVECTDTFFGTPSYDTTYSRCSLRGGGGYNESPQFTALTDLWVHARIGANTYAAYTHYPLELLDGTGTSVIRLRGVHPTSVLYLDYWNGSAWINASSCSVNIDLEWHDMDIHAVVNSVSGSLALYIAGTERINVTGLDLSNITSIRKVRCTSNTFDSRNSQLIVATDITIGMKLMTVVMTGNSGTNTAWSGDYTGIDEIVYSDGDFITSDSANQVETYTGTPVSALAGYVRAVVISARAKRDNSGPQNLQFTLRSAGTNYFSSTKALDVAYGAFEGIWETDPATGIAFVLTDIAALEYGVKSIA